MVYYKCLKWLANGFEEAISDQEPSALYVVTVYIHIGERDCFLEEGRPEVRQSSSNLGGGGAVRCQMLHL
jgi:hypothetical protein